MEPPHGKRFTLLQARRCSSPALARTWASTGTDLLEDVHSHWAETHLFQWKTGTYPHCPWNPNKVLPGVLSLAWQIPGSDPYVAQSMEASHDPWKKACPHLGRLKTERIEDVIPLLSSARYALDVPGPSLPEKEKEKAAKLGELFWAVTPEMLPYIKTYDGEAIKLYDAQRHWWSKDETSFLFHLESPNPVAKTKGDEFIAAAMRLLRHDTDFRTEKEKQDIIRDLKAVGAISKTWKRVGSAGPPVDAAKVMALTRFETVYKDETCPLGFRCSCEKFHEHTICSRLKFVLALRGVLDFSSLKEEARKETKKVAVVGIEEDEHAFFGVSVSDEEDEEAVTVMADVDAATSAIEKRSPQSERSTVKMNEAIALLRRHGLKKIFDAENTDKIGPKFSKLLKVLSKESGTLAKAFIGQTGPG